VRLLPLISSDTLKSKMKVSLRGLLLWLLYYRQRKTRRSSPLFSDLLYSSSSHHAYARAVLQLGKVKILSQSFAYLMNNRIQGDYAEFGVYKGETLLEAISAAKVFEQAGMRFCVFDSFQGLPSIRSEKDIGVFQKGEFAFSYEDFMANLRKERVDLERLDIYPGYYEESLSKLNDERSFSFVLVDCDLYASTVPVLKYLEGKLVQGAIVAFDDWFCYDSPNKGVRQAVSEWLIDYKTIELIEYENFHWAGKAFIVNYRS